MAALESSFIDDFNNCALHGRMVHEKEEGDDLIVFKDYGFAFSAQHYMLYKERDGKYSKKYFI